MAKPIVIYTAITNRYDNLKEPLHVVNSADYICFSDCVFKSKIWNIQPIPCTDWGRVRQARYPKILPHRFFPEYKISIWVDGSIKIIGNLEKLINLYLNKCDFALCEHSCKRPSIEAEVKICIKKFKRQKEVFIKQLAAYKNVKFKGPIYETGMLLRRHNNIKNAMEDWWGEVIKYSNRDQISLPYIIWKHSLNIKAITMNVRNNRWTKVIPHGK